MMSAQKADDLYQDYRSSVPTNHMELQEMFRKHGNYKTGKSKVSKWTKVKAAFKWEKVNLQPPTQHGTMTTTFRESLPLSTRSNSDLIK